LKAGEHLQVYEEISRALWGYASDKLTIPLSELSKENIAGKLSQRSVSESTVNTFLRTIEDCEMARYGGQTSAANSATAYSSAIELITKIEGEVKA
jgi:ferritin-like metal-binding protein YciE